ncbi:MAG: response regulator, partial [Acidobacteria bacterium]|nr:response regulator [Acidobacteriota bacterium]
LAGPDIELLSVGTPEKLTKLCGSEYLDGIVLDLEFATGEVIPLIGSIHAQLAPRVPPIMLFSGRKRKKTDARASQIERLSRVSPVRYAATLGCLVYDVALLLHRKDADLSEAQRRTVADVGQGDPMLSGKTVLVVDDDLRNIFALTSLLENRGLNVLHAENGKAGLEALKHRPDVDVVLMDVMMPDMDGYQTTRAIRQIPEFESLPIIALTAKAMKGDREKCMQAGATDYVTKPVDVEHLFSVLRVSIARRVGPVLETVALE